MTWVSEAESAPIKSLRESAPPPPQVSVTGVLYKLARWRLFTIHPEVRLVLDSWQERRNEE